MKRVLIVKTSSLGDVVHNLPVASDIAAAFPGAQIDWVVEESFAALPALHPAIRRILPVALRRWRKAFWRPDTRREARAFVKMLRVDRYDAIICDVWGAKLRQRYFLASGVTVSSTRLPSRSTITFTGVPIFTASSA